MTRRRKGRLRNVSGECIVSNPGESKQARGKSPERSHIRNARSSEWTSGWKETLWERDALAARRHITGKLLRQGKKAGHPAHVGGQSEKNKKRGSRRA